MPKGFNVLRHANIGSRQARADAETTPLRHPEHFQYEFNLADIAEVWRRGSVDHVLAPRPDGPGPRGDPTLEAFAGQVSDSGEGRWTVQAANDAGVPAHVLTAALFERFASRGQDRLPEQGAVGDAQGLRRPRGEDDERHEAPRRRARVLRRDWRPRLQEDFPGPARARPPGTAVGAGRGARPLRLDPRSVHRTGARQRHRERRARPEGVPRAGVAAAVRRRRLQRSEDLRSAAGRARHSLPAGPLSRHSAQRLPPSSSTT